MSRLDAVDLTQKLSSDEYDDRLEAAQDRLLELRLLLGGQTGTHELGPPVCVVFEGWDASGKGGALKRLVEPLDPRHVRVVAYAAPTPDEKRHHYLQRFWPVLPGKGGMAVLDRSWYGRLLVERVEGFATETEWRRAYDEIAAFERMLTDDGMCLIKFWMHVSDEEQLRRFEKRRDHPLKSWKLTAEDWRNRERRGEYEAALEELFARTDVESAPWHLVAGDQKKFARVQVIETVNREIERAIQASGQAVPPPSSDGS
jgi:polyphosphate kinase 2 (PPK2 family)